MTKDSIFQTADDVSRRRFLRGAASTFLGLGTMPWLARAANVTGDIPLRAATARNVIYLYMSGGMSQLDTFDTKPGTTNQGPTESIATNVPGLKISQHFPNMARLMDKVAIVNTMQSTQGAHAQGQYYMHTSYELRGTIRHPSLGAWYSKMAGKINPTLPAHVAVNSSQNMASGGFLESTHGPLPIGNPEAGLQNSKRVHGVSEERFSKRLSRVAEMNEAFSERYAHKSVDAYQDMYSQAVRLMKSSDLQAFDISQESDVLREAYGDSSFGQGCLLARRLVEHNVRFVEVVSGGWDTHDDNFDAMEEKCPPLDQTLATLLIDLESRGLLDETLVVVATEFGRTPEITAQRNGRNHFPKAFTCLLAGGGIQGGYKYGRTQDDGMDVTENPVSVPDFNATIAYALGLPLDHTMYSPSGRPFTVAHKGQALKGLFA